MNALEAFAREVIGELADVHRHGESDWHHEYMHRQVIFDMARKHGLVRGSFRQPGQWTFRSLVEPLPILSSKDAAAAACLGGEL